MIISEAGHLPGRQRRVVQADRVDHTPAGPVVKVLDLDSSELFETNSARISATPAARPSASLQANRAACSAGESARERTPASHYSDRPTPGISAVQPIVKRAVFFVRGFYARIIVSLLFLSRKKRPVCLRKEHG